MEEGSSGSPAVDQTTSNAVSQATHVHTSPKSTRVKSNGSGKRGNVSCRRCQSRKLGCRTAKGEFMIKPEPTCQACKKAQETCIFDQATSNRRGRHTTTTSAPPNTSSTHAASDHDQSRSKREDETHGVSVTACDRSCDVQTPCCDDYGKPFNPYYLDCKLAHRDCTLGDDTDKKPGTESWNRWACQSCYDGRRPCVASASAVENATLYPCVWCLNGPPGVSETCAPHGRKPPPWFDLLHPVPETDQALTEAKSPFAPRTQTNLATPDFKMEDDNEAVATASRFSWPTKQEAASGDLSAVGSDSEVALNAVWDPTLAPMPPSPLECLSEHANIGEGHNDFAHQPHAANSAFLSYQPSLPSEQEGSVQEQPLDQFGYAGGDSWQTLYDPSPE